MGADGNGRDYGNLSPQSKTNDTEPISELDGVPLPPWSEDLVVASRKVDQDASSSKDGFRRGGCRFDTTGTRHHAS
jgi:hypothetical protein